MMIFINLFVLVFSKLSENIVSNFKIMCEKVAFLCFLQKSEKNLSCLFEIHTQTYNWTKKCLTLEPLFVFWLF